MNTYQQSNLDAEKLSSVSRVTRIAFGVALLAFTMTYNGVLGVLAVLPLIAVYPILTGILGYGLVELALVRGRHAERPASLRRTSRVIHVIVGVALIGAVMAGVTQQAWLALLGIYPILLGALGTNLLSEAFATRRVLQGAGRVYQMGSQAQRPGNKARAAVTAHHHAQKAA